MLMEIQWKILDEKGNLKSIKDFNGATQNTPMIQKATL